MKTFNSRLHISFLAFVSFWCGALVLIWWLRTLYVYFPFLQGLLFFTGVVVLIMPRKLLSNLVLRDLALFFCTSGFFIWIVNLGKPASYFNPGVKIPIQRYFETGFALLALCTLWVIAYQLRNCLLKAQDKKRTEFAQAVNYLVNDDSYLEDAEYDFSLYLRPFEITQAYRYRNPKFKSFFSPSAFQYKIADDFETLLAQALEHRLPLIGFGIPGEASGAGRITITDEVWKGKIERLMKTCSLIVVVPSSNAGTLWEVKKF